FLAAPLDSLPDPDGLVDVPAAAERLVRALRTHEPMTIYGDYDADGVSATSILLRGLQTLGGEVSFYIPSRFTEGYGLNDAALHRLAEAGRHLVVSVDCGVTATGEIARAGERKQDVIVVDHHEPGPALPPAVAVVDPKRRDAGASFREYSAAGLAFQVLRAVRRRSHQPPMPEELLDLAALGTIADVESSRLQEAPAIVLAGEGWHPGVIGIVASPLVERYYRPVVLMAVQDGTAKGSARSIERFHLVEALAECADLLDRFGGHAM